MFQNLRAGSPIYLFDKDKLTAEVGEVVRTENPVDTFGNKIFQTGLMQPKMAFIDVVATIGGKECTFYHVCAEATIADFGTKGAILCDNQNEFVDAISSYKKTSERILSETPKHQSIVERCDVILTEFDPRLRSEKEQSEEITKLKSRMDSVDTSLSKIQEMLAKALEHGS